MAFVYLLPCAGPEDLAKIGMTDHPLGRWSAFSSRWFETFDLARALLVEVDGRRQARRLEASLHRTLAAHRCPMPLHLRHQFGGGTEWFRGAHAEVERRLEAWRADGAAVPVDARLLLERQMAEQAERLPALLEQAYLDCTAGVLSPAQRRALRDLLDAHRHFDPHVEARLSADALSSLRG